MAPTHLSQIAQTIQLAITPVFLLVGISGLLNVITTRLARIVDRVRALEDDVLVADEPRRRDEIGELAVLARRMMICQWAIASCTVSAMLVCVMVIVLFVASIGALDFAMPVTLLFIAVMAALTSGLSLFFWEVNISIRVVRVREEYVRAGRQSREG
ncbi:MAG TPA: DUF2721 domain-containing protein [Allosphingosinicella sp.]|jgi:hypothetical protein